MVENSLFNTTATAAAVDVLGYACRFVILRVTVAELIFIYCATEESKRAAVCLFRYLRR